MYGCVSVWGSVSLSVIVVVCRADWTCEMYFFMCVKVPFSGSEFHNRLLGDIKFWKIVFYFSLYNYVYAQVFPLLELYNRKSRFSIHPNVSIIGRTQLGSPTTEKLQDVSLVRIL